VFSQSVLSHLLESIINWIIVVDRSRKNDRTMDYGSTDGGKKALDEGSAAIRSIFIPL
jgi:hypothetical protein